MKRFYVKGFHPESDSYGTKKNHLTLLRRCSNTTPVFPLLIADLAIMKFGIVLKIEK